MTSRKTYEKNKLVVSTNDKFIYCDSVYKIWSWGASLVEEKYYSSTKPITIKKKNLTVKKKDYKLCRFFELQFAPEEYLINNGFKIVENETGCD